MFPLIVLKGIWLGLCLYSTIKYVTQLAVNLAYLYTKCVVPTGGFKWAFSWPTVGLCSLWVVFYFLTHMPDMVGRYLGGIKIW